MTKSADKFDKAVDAYMKYVPIAGIAFIVVVLAFYIYPRSDYSFSTRPDFWGAFGDYVGGILNPIFGFITLVGLVLTVGLQKQILAVQKQELAETKDELAKSAEALNIQNKTMLSQNFEGTFFRMLEKQAELFNRIEYIPGSDRRGSKALFLILSGLKTRASQGTNFLYAYEVKYNEINSTLGPYFRNLYHTLKLIDKNKHLSDLEKYDYSSLARAQLSSDEITLIFYNCLTKPGQGLKQLIIRYRMLKHIDTSKLANPDLINDSNLYPPETYLARD